MCGIKGLAGPFRDQGFALIFNITLLRSFSLEIENDNI